MQTLELKKVYNTKLLKINEIAEVFQARLIWRQIESLKCL